VWQGLTSLLIPWLAILVITVVDLIFGIIFVSLYWFNTQLLRDVEIKATPRDLAVKLTAAGNLWLELLKESVVASDIRLSRDMETNLIDMLPEPETSDRWFTLLKKFATLSIKGFTRLRIVNKVLTSVGTVVLSGAFAIFLSHRYAELALIKPVYPRWIYYIVVMFLLGAATLALAASTYRIKNARATKVAALLLGASVLAALPYAILTPLWGPSVEVGGKTNGSGVVAEGALLAYDGSAWYVLNVDPNRRNDVPKLLTVPNGEARKVCIWETAPIEQLTNNKLNC
jgi:hypothetical protein